MTWKQLALATASLLAATVTATAQAPSTDVWLVPLSPGEGDYEVGTPANLTDRDGYDNQPKFLPDGRLVYTSQRDGQTDIYLHDPAAGTTEQLTDTEESEYSPTPMPSEAEISVVRDYGDGVQQLWAFPLGGGEPRLLLTHELGPIGYHAWVDEARLILFVLGEPMTLQLADLGATAGTRMADNPGRALAAMPDGSGMSFVHKVGEEEWWVSAIDPDGDVPGDPDSKPIRQLVRTRPGREDYAWGPDGSLWMGDGSELYSWRPGQEDWELAADFAPAGISGITRLAFHPEGGSLAVVAERPQPPLLTIRLAQSNEAEEQAKVQLERLLEEYDLERWLFTREVVIDSDDPIPHSHPVLTLNADSLDDDAAQLAVLLHEQFHWFNGPGGPPWRAANAELEELFPDAPTGFADGGARDHRSTISHLIICDLELQAMTVLVGEEKARAVLSSWEHYPWVYEQVLNNPVVREVTEKHGWVVP